MDSPDICKAMLGDTYSSTDVENLVYTQVFPYLYVDETQTEVLPYICLEVDIPRIPTHTIKDMKITVWAYCHKDCMKYSLPEYLGTRVDILADIIERLLSDSDDFGIGHLHLESVTYIFPQNKYYGKQMIFTIPDFKMKDR